MTKTKEKVKRDSDTEYKNYNVESGAMIQTFDLKKSYNITEGIDVKALDGVSITIKRGEFVSVMGPSGSGKTTLLNMIGALDNPTSGAVFINGTNVAYMDDKERTHLRLKEIGFIFQFYNLVPVLTAYENVELPMIFARKPKDLREEKVNYFLDVVGLSEKKDFLPSELSGGEQQRVAIARSLSNEPAILIADEPTGELDTKMGMEIVQLLRELNKELNQTILMVTHDPDVGALGERILRMRDGKIIGEDIKVNATAPEIDAESVERDEPDFHTKLNKGAYYLSQKGHVPVVMKDIIEEGTEVLKVAPEIKVEIVEEVVEVKEDIVELKEEVVELKEDLVELKEDVVEEIVELKERVVEEVVEEIVELKEEIVELKEDFVGEVLETKENLVELKERVVEEVVVEIVELKEEVVEEIEVTQKDFNSIVNAGAYYLSQRGYSYDQLCWLLAEKQLQIQMDKYEITTDLIKEKAEEVFNSSCKYDELCWLISELDIMSNQGYLD